MNANPPAGGQDMVPGSAPGQGWNVTGSVTPEPSPAPTQPQWDAAARAAHYSAGGYSTAGVQALATPSAPLQQSTWQDWAYYLKNAIKAGREPAELLREMQARGCPEQPSYALMRDVVNGVHQAVRQEMLTGGALLAVGLGVTFFTYTMASSGGGSYLLFWGPLVFGGFILLRGIWNWTRLPRY